MESETTSTAALSEEADVKLSANLQADLTALQNDLEQARHLADDYQRQLAGKSNDCAQMKRVLEKTEADLEGLKQVIVELRQERLRLANEVVKVPILEHRLKRVSEERDHLRSERAALWAQAATAQVGKEPASDVPAVNAAAWHGNDRIQAKRLIAELLASVEDLKELVEPSNEEATQPVRDRIVEVSFGR